MEQYAQQNYSTVVPFNLCMVNSSFVIFTQLTFDHNFPNVLLTKGKQWSDSEIIVKLRLVLLLYSNNDFKLDHKERDWSKIRDL